MAPAAANWEGTAVGCKRSLHRLGLQQPWFPLLFSAVQCHRDCMFTQKQKHTFSLLSVQCLHARSPCFLFWLSNM